MAPWILWSRIEHDRTSGCRECRKRQKSKRGAGREGGRERSHSRHVENSARITFKPTVGLFCSGIPDPAFCNSLSLPGDAPGSRCIPRDNATWPSQTVSTLSLFSITESVFRIIWLPGNSDFHLGKLTFEEGECWW